MFEAGNNNIREEGLRDDTFLPGLIRTARLVLASLSPPYGYHPLRSRGRSPEIQRVYRTHFVHDLTPSSHPLPQLFLKV